MSITFYSDSTGGTIQSSNGNIILDNGTTLTGTDVGSLRNTGRVVQTVYLRYDTKTTWSIPVSANTIVTDMNITITPRYATSRILLCYMLSYEAHWDSVWRLGRNNVEIVRNSTDGNRWSGWANTQYDYGDNSSTPLTSYYMYVDSPGTTAATTYNLMIGGSGASAYTLYMNRTVSSAGQDSYEVGISNVIAQEIL